MKKKLGVLRVAPAENIAPRTEQAFWHNGAEIEIGLYARSLHRSAKLLLENLDRRENPKTAWDVGPIITLYRQALELEMKFLVGEGGRFVASPTDHLTLWKTQSLRWLAQIVCQVIQAVHWEAEFRCRGVQGLTEFRAVIAELEAMEPMAAVRYAKRSEQKPGDVPPQLRKARLIEIAWKLDGLIELLAATADGLAAMAGWMDLGAGDDGEKRLVH